MTSFMTSSTTSSRKPCILHRFRKLVVELVIELVVVLVIVLMPNALGQFGSDAMRRAPAHGLAAPR